MIGQQRPTESKSDWTSTVFIQRLVIGGQTATRHGLWWVSTRARHDRTKCMLRFSGRFVVLLECGSHLDPGRKNTQKQTRLYSVTRIFTLSTVNDTNRVYNRRGGVSCLTRGHALGHKTSRARERTLTDKTSCARGRVNRIARGYNKNRCYSLRITTVCDHRLSTL
jgi:hypothetical protein